MSEIRLHDTKGSNGKVVDRRAPGRDAAQKALVSGNHAFEKKDIPETISVHPHPKSQVLNQALDILNSTRNLAILADILQSQNRMEEAGQRKSEFRDKFGEVVRIALQDIDSIVLSPLLFANIGNSEFSFGAEKKLKDHYSQTFLEEIADILRDLAKKAIIAELFDMDKAQCDRAVKLEVICSILDCTVGKAEKEDVFRTAVREAMKEITRRNRNVDRRDFRFLDVLLVLRKTHELKFAAVDAINWIMAESAKQDDRLCVLEVRVSEGDVSVDKTRRTNNNVGRILHARCFSVNRREQIERSVERAGSLTILKGFYTGEDCGWDIREKLRVEAARVSHIEDVLIRIMELREVSIVQRDLGFFEDMKDTVAILEDLLREFQQWEAAVGEGANAKEDRVVVKIREVMPPKPVGMEKTFAEITLAQLNRFLKRARQGQ